MTISTTSNTVIAQGNGLTTSFDFSFPVPLASELYVYYTAANGSVTLLLPSQYSVTGVGTADGGSVTYPLSGSPIANGTYLTIQRIVPYQQLTSLVNQSGYYPNVVENALDYLTMQTQQLAQASQLSLQVPLTGTPANLTLPGATARALSLVGFDSVGNAITYPIPASVGAGNMTAELGSNGHPGFKNGTDFVGGTTTTLTLSQAYGTVANVLVAFDGLYVEKDAYTLNGNQIIFGSWSGSTFTPSPIPASVQNVDVVGGTTLSAYIPGIGSVGPQALAAGAVTAPAIAAGAVTAGAIATGAVSTKLNTEALNQLATGQFYQNLGARVSRINDRIFLGKATVNDGQAWSATTGNQDYVSQNIPQGPSTALSQMAVLSSVGGTGILAGTRTSDSISVGTQDAIGITSVVINDATGANAQGGFSQYLEAQMKPGAGYTVGLEIDSVNQTGGALPMTPYTPFTGTPEFCANVMLGAGGARAGVNPSSAGMLFLDNGTTFDKGIVFMSGSLDANLEAMSFYSGCLMKWWSSTTQSTSFIQSQATTAQNGILMNDSAIVIGNVLGGTPGAITAFNNSAGVNYLGVTPGATTHPVQLSALGSDANIDLVLSPQGAGRLQFGGPVVTTVGAAGGASALPATPLGYLQVVIPGSGTLVNIPYFTHA